MVKFIKFYLVLCMMLSSAFFKNTAAQKYLKLVQRDEYVSDSLVFNDTNVVTVNKSDICIAGRRVQSAEGVQTGWTSSSLNSHAC